MSEPEDVVARSRRLREAATPGPWKVEWDDRPYARDGFSWSTFAIGPTHGITQYRIDNPDVHDRAVSLRNADAALIAATPTLLSELEAEAERLRGRLAEAKEERDWYAAEYCQSVQDRTGLPLSEIRRENGLDAEAEDKA